MNNWNFSGNICWSGLDSPARGNGGAKNLSIYLTLKGRNSENTYTVYKYKTGMEKFTEQKDEEMTTFGAPVRLGPVNLKQIHSK